jgi:hypothetical protein
MLILPPGHGQAVAARRQLTGRERWVAGLGAVLSLLLIVAVVISLTGGSKAPGKGCLNVTFASSMGADVIDSCGVAAKQTCAAVGTPGGYTGAAGRELARDCRRLGLPVGG